MCGIVGLLLKNGSKDGPSNGTPNGPSNGSLGSLLLPMFQCMAERGPDSAGLAVFGPPVPANERRFNLFIPDDQFDWPAFAERFRSQSGAPCRIEALANHAVLTTTFDPSAFRLWLAECDPAPHLLSVGRSIDLYKDEGHPAEIARRYHFETLAGTHCVGHTRMATESAISPAHAHPFTAGEDFCLVHNGSLSNPYMLRRKLEARGLHFETDNDTEAACRFLEWRMQQGETLDEALQTAFAELDGFYTLLIATAGQLTLVRDAFACKPAVVAETDAYVAVASEFRSLAHLPGVAEARVFEPLPEEIYTWKL